MGHGFKHAYFWRAGGLLPPALFSFLLSSSNFLQNLYTKAFWEYSSQRVSLHTAIKDVFMISKHLSLFKTVIYVARAPLDAPQVAHAVSHEQALSQNIAPWGASNIKW
jgi:phosphoglycerol transferase MdoB-like AlkP superfamily enzyme